jgi:methanogenic corrinoid protein MtbC1
MLNEGNALAARKHILEQYLTKLLEGDRSACRAIIETTLQSGIPANTVYMDIIWPIMLEINRLHEKDIISSAQEAFATRINRTIVDQLQNKLPRRPDRGKRIVVCSTSAEQGELGAQMTSDLFESDGWESRFLGSSVDNDDILSFVHDYRPDVLVLYGVAAGEAPRIRALIDKIKSVNACPGMKIMVSGGLFNRAEGLWEEIGADMFAATGSEAVRVATADREERPVPQRTIKRRKKTAVPDSDEAEISAGIA